MVIKHEVEEEESKKVKFNDILMIVYHTMCTSKTRMVGEKATRTIFTDASSVPNLLLLEKETKK